MKHIRDRPITTYVQSSEDNHICLKSKELLNKKQQGGNAAKHVCKFVDLFYRNAKTVCFPFNGLKTYLTIKDSKNKKQYGHNMVFFNFKILFSRHIWTKNRCQKGI